jgi:hypothetical protein
MYVTWLVSNGSGWLKLDARENIELISMTCDVSQKPSSGLQVFM